LHVLEVLVENGLDILLHRDEILIVHGQRPEVGLLGPSYVVLRPREILRTLLDLLDQPQQLHLDQTEQLISEFDLTLVVLQLHNQEDVLDRLLQVLEITNRCTFSLSTISRGVCSLPPRLSNRPKN
jgi:hypothetical protein